MYLAVKYSFFVKLSLDLIYAREPPSNEMPKLSFLYFSKASSFKTNIIAALLSIVSFLAQKIFTQ